MNEKLNERKWNRMNKRELKNEWTKENETKWIKANEKKNDKHVKWRITAEIESEKLDLYSKSFSADNRSFFL